MPLDPSAPQQRSTELLQLAQPDAVVYDSRAAAQGLNTQRNWLDLHKLIKEGSGHRQAQSAEQQQQQQHHHHHHHHHEQGTLYVLYTSGSTGTPLGVRGTVSGLLNRANWMQSAYPLLPGRHTVALSTAPAFVDHVWELLAPLLAGVDAVVLPDGWALQPAAAAQALVRHRVTHLVSLPWLLVDRQERVLCLNAVFTPMFLQTNRTANT